MINHTLAKSLWEKAFRIRRRDVAAALEEKDFNLCIRRAQEVVELALKSALKFLGYDYPKHHDVANLFREACKTKNVSIPGIALKRICDASADLAEKRGLAFYIEETYGSENAQKAVEEADFVLKNLKGFMKFS